MTVKKLAIGVGSRKPFTKRWATERESEASQAKIKGGERWSEIYC